MPSNTQYAVTVAAKGEDFWFAVQRYESALLVYFSTVRPLHEIVICDHCYQILECVQKQTTAVILKMCFSMPTGWHCFVVKDCLLRLETASNEHSGVALLICSIVSQPTIPSCSCNLSDYLSHMPSNKCHIHRIVVHLCQIVICI